MAEHPRLERANPLHTASDRGLDYLRQTVEHAESEIPTNTTCNNGAELL